MADKVMECNSSYTVEIAKQKLEQILVEASTSKRILLQAKSYRARPRDISGKSNRSDRSHRRRHLHASAM